MATLSLNRYDVLSPGCLVPEIWMLSYPTEKAKTHKASSESNINNGQVTDKMGRYLITGFIAGEQADQVSGGHHSRPLIDLPLSL
jgi:hypothetical protein